MQTIFEGSPTGGSSATSSRSHAVPALGLGDRPAAQERAEPTLARLVQRDDLAVAQSARAGALPGVEGDQSHGGAAYP